MNIISPFTNIDFLSLGIVIAANLLLGFIVFHKDHKNVTNILFLTQTVILTSWSVLNYLTYHITNLGIVLWIERLVMFFAVPNSLIFLLLMHTFPSSVFKLSKRTILFIVIIGFITMGITLTPLVFKSTEIVPWAPTPQPIVGPGILIFFFVAVLSIPLGIYFLVKRYRISQELEKLQLRYLLIGVATMFSLILFFDFLLPSVYGDTRFIPLSAMFTFPFVAFTFYAIVKHHLLNAKVIAAEVLIFVLSITSLIEVIIADNIFIILFRAFVFILVLSFGILLIQSVLREVEQREELERLTQQLQNANDKLEDLSKFKTQLLSLASHQVKSPLAAIKGFATILSQGLYGPLEPKIKETIDKIYSSADGLLGLISMLLDMRKVEEGRMDYQFAKTDLTAMVRGVVEELQPFADQKKLALSYDGSNDSVYVNADSLKLKQVVQNLIDNAIKYTPSGFIKVALTVAGGTATISVSDSGLGIPADLAPHLFEEFIRDERVKKEILGTGLGLFIARKIVEAHGGTISGKSDGEGKGSTFSVSLKTI